MGVHDAANQLRSDLLMAGRNLSIIRSSTTEVTAPWLLREMAPRIASTLNYFLLHLAGALQEWMGLLRAMLHGPCDVTWVVICLRSSKQMTTQASSHGCWLLKFWRSVVGLRRQRVL